MNYLIIEFYCCNFDYFLNEIPKNRSLQCTLRVCLETIYAKTALYLLCYLLPSHNEPEMKKND